MAWTRQGDNARSHPVMQRVRTVAADDREPAEFFGIIGMAYEYSGEHYTDYEILPGAFFQICDCRDQADRIIKLALKVGALTKIKMAGLQGYKLLQDENFFHIITKAERDKKLQHRNDTRDTELTSRVRHRDGDECRWCGKTVQFGNTRGHNGGKYGRTDEIGELLSGEPGSMDHLDKKPATFETLVVACLSCNQRRGDPAAASSDWALRPVPAHPIYSDRTVEFLARNGITVEPSDLRPGNQPDNATATPSRGPRTVDPAAGRTPTSPDAVTDVVPDPPGPRSVRTRSAGSGRDGLGVVVGSAGQPRRRGRRGRRRFDG